ncbi:MAG: FMN-binding protein [Clostridia bacterium]|nr:FMN-binding protein [Clostridia bacterium]
MKKLRVVLAMVMAFCLVLTFVSASAEKSLEGDANVDQRNYPSTAPFIHPPFYNVKLIVEVDDNGIITSVKDNGTGAAGSVQEGNEEFWANKNKPFFDAAINGGLLEKYVGKTLEEVKAMDMTSGGTDAISGATMVSAAAQEAVINAMEGKKGKAFLPNKGNVLPLESVEGNVITLKNELPADFDLQVLDIRWSVYNDEIVPADSYTAELKDGKLVITFPDIAALKAGYYYVNVVDGSGTYRSPAFEGGPAAAQAPYFIIDSGLTANDISFDGKAVVLKSGSMADYLKNIRHVQILADDAEKPVEQEIVGHHGTVGSFIALDENGVLNADGVVKARNGDESPLFVDGKQYTVKIASFGYPELTFRFSKGESAALLEGSSEAKELLDSIKGTYEPLFPVITRPEYDQLWLDPCSAVVGEEAAPQVADMLKAACNGTICGQEAIDAFGDGSGGAQFDCLFINGVSTITFDGAAISGADESGNQVFSHEYTYIGKLSLSGMMEGYLYETADADAGEFKYFFMMPDTPATTYHLEFRYGSNTDDLAKYNEGAYAYWLAAGFPVGSDADTVKNVIELFCLENMDYSAHSEESVAQLKDLGFEGKWIADMSPFGEAYADAEPCMTRKRPRPDLYEWPADPGL